MSTRDDILAAARALSGLRYSLDPPPDGQSTIDCSLLILKAAQAAGVPLTGVRTAEQIRQAVQSIENDDVKPGDLIFFADTYDAAGPAGPDGLIASHVGISLGRGTGLMIDAHERDGADVAETNIRTDYWSPKIIGFGRLPGLATDVANPPATAPLNVPGIDVASYQGAPDWAAVAASGVKFAITKATEGADYTNPTLARNWQEIKRVGLVRGAYHYARPEQGNTAESEASYFLRAVERNGGAQAGDLLVLDLEPTTPVNGIRAWVLEWLQRVTDRAGVRPMVYTGAWVVQQQGLTSVRELAGYGLWLAAYQASMPPAPAPWSEVAIWQHSSTGSVPGIAGDVDLNWSSLEMLKRYGKSGAVLPAADPKDARISGLETALAHLADVVVAKAAGGASQRDEALAEAKRIREQYLGPRSAA